MNFKEINLDKVLKYTQPAKYIVQSTEYSDKFKTPVLTAGKNFLLGYTNEKEGIYKDVPAIIFDDFTTSFHYVDFPFKVKSSALKILNVRSDQVDIKYVYYQMEGVKIDTQLHKRYWISRFSKKEIPLPSLETQKQIAQTLDNAATLRDKTQQLIAEYDQLAQSIFLDMFGDPVTNPKGWNLIKLGDAGELNRGKSKHRPRNAPELLGGKYPLIQTGDIANSNGYINEYNSTYSELGLSQSKMWPKGTLCITIAANIAKTGILKFDACFPDSVVGFIPNKLTNNIFVQYWMSFLQKIIEEKAPVSAQKNINLKILRELEFYCPPFHLQNQFAEKIALIEQQKDLAKQELQESEDLFQALLQKAFHPAEKHDESELV